MTTGVFADSEMMDYLARVAEVDANPPGVRAVQEPETPEEGATFNFEPQRRSPVSLGNKALPPRVPVFDRNGGISHVPPTLVFKRDKRTGERVFYSPDEYQRLVNEGRLPPPRRPEYIAETCRICEANRAPGAPPRRFETYAQYTAHMRGFHQLEWEEEQRTAETRRAQEQMDIMRRLVETLAGPAPTATEPLTVPEPPPVVAEVKPRKPIVCEHCGEEFDKPLSKARHVKSRVCRGTE